MLTGTTHFHKMYTNTHLIGRPTCVVPVDKFFINFSHSDL